MRTCATLGLLVLGACSEEAVAPQGRDGGADPGADASAAADAGLTGALAIEPAAVTLVTDGTTPAEQAFRVYLEHAGGRTEVTDQAVFRTSAPELGAMVGSTLTTGRFGTAGRVVARVGGEEIAAEVTVVLRRGGDGLPAEIVARFDTVTPTDADRPEVVYPNDRVVLPPNLGAIEIHLEKGHREQTAFRLELTGAHLDLALPARCEPLEGGCRFALAGADFAAVAASERGRGPVSLTVLAMTDDGRRAGRSTPVALEIARADVRGGLYYWTTSRGTGIMRVDFGDLETPPERFFPFEGGGCYGCHALSPNGRRMTVSRDGQWQGQLALLDVGGRRALVRDTNAIVAQFQAWSPDSRRFVAIYGDGDPIDTTLSFRDGETAELLEQVDVGSEITHPDWSPRGDRIAFTHVTHHYSSQRPGRGGIAAIQRTAGGWSAPELWVPPADGVNHYTPAFAPDGSFLVYGRSECPPGQIYGGTCDADADPSSALFAIPTGGGTAIPLVVANQPGKRDRGETRLSNTYPKWAPFVDPATADGAGRRMWLTFSSRRSYGLRAPPSGGLWLWMVAIDPDRIQAGADGSAAAFALPFQDLSTSNHMAQWTAAIAPPDPDPGDAGVGDAAPDPGSGQCLGLGDPCDPAGGAACCAGGLCGENGPGLFICRPDT